MATYLYGLLLERNAHLVPPHVTGVGGTALRVVECERVGALVSTVAAKPRSASLDDVRAHDHALQAVVHHGATVVSVRFGQTFADDAEVCHHVAKRAPRVRALLESRDGCVEMRLLMTSGSELSALGTTPEAQSPEPLGPGTAYLEQLKSEQSGNRITGLGLRAAIGPLVLGEYVEALPNGRGAAFSHLIRREDEPAYRDVISQQPALKEATLVGPLAFYSFAEADDE